LAPVTTFGFGSKDARVLWRKFSTSIAASQPQDLPDYKSDTRPFIDGRSPDLEEFFDVKHNDDRTPDGHKRRDYLRGFLKAVSTGDVVITLNWDTTAERTLAELGRWNPTTGYGFPKPLIGSSVGSRPVLLDSPVRVLKLHGSFGWYRRSSGLYFADALLDSFSPQLTDPNQPEPGLGPPENRLLLYPSFLKQVNDREMLRVWQQADRALREATQVRIVGYSLPEATVQFAHF
jgi:hypothetical protein